MKWLARSVLALLVIFLFSYFPSLSYASSITSYEGKTAFLLSEAPHRNLSGEFFDRSLEAKLGAEGSLGRLLTEAGKVRASERVFYIDPMLIEEIVDLSGGFSLEAGASFEPSVNANQWLTRFRTLAATSEVIALNYGAPDIAWLLKSAPSEQQINHQLSRDLLSSLLGVEVSNRNLTTSIDPAQQSQKIALGITRNFTSARKALRSINRYVPTEETRRLRVLATRMLNTQTDRDFAERFARNFREVVNQYEDSLRISKGRFTLTSSLEKVPVTIINDFDNDLPISLSIKSTNTRVRVSQPPVTNVPANSKVVVEVPLEVLSSGQSELLVTMRVNEKYRVGEQVRLRLNLAVISPLTTWITTGSGVILLLAAVFQSLRRVKRSRLRKNEEVNS